MNKDHGEPYWDDPNYTEPEGSFPTEKICNRCGKGNLNWEEENNGKWLLYDSHTGEVHKCSKKSVVPLNELLNQKI